MTSNINDPVAYGSSEESNLKILKDEEIGTIKVYRQDGALPILTQNVRKDHRPYLHPIIAPDGQGSLTEYSPGHHKHQTGLYWGFTRVNGTPIPKEKLSDWFYVSRHQSTEISQAVGRDYFHNPGGDHWQLKSASVISAGLRQVEWQTSYNMIDEGGKTIMVEVQSWSMCVDDGQYILDLEWKGEAKTDITINQFPYGGMFLRMPWRKGMLAQVTNSVGDQDLAAEGKQATWIDLGMQVEGREDFAHIAIFDHPTNNNSPTAWRVDGQFGVGPSRSIMGDWKIEQGKSEIIKHRVLIYTGNLRNLEQPSW